jgi:hypothetical protein
MNVTVEIPDDRAAHFQREAKARGLTVDRWLLQLAEQSAPSESIAHLQKSNSQEWMRQFRAWSQSHDRSTPTLSTEALSRESIYSDRA